MSFWWPWASFGDPGALRDPPREPSRKSDVKVDSWVLPGIAKQAFCRHGMVVFEVCVFFAFFCDVAKLPFCAHRTQLFDENVGSLTAFWPPLGVPFFTIFGIFCVFSILFLYIFLKRFFDGFWGLWGPPPTVKTMVSCTRNHGFHISTWSSKMTENCAQRVPFGMPLGSFW